MQFIIQKLVLFNFVYSFELPPLGGTGRSDMLARKFDIESLALWVVLFSRSDYCWTTEDKGKEVENA
jgi:hypothetical protein